MVSSQDDKPSRFRLNTFFCRRNGREKCAQLVFFYCRTDEENIHFLKGAVPVVSVSIITGNLKIVYHYYKFFPPGSDLLYFLHKRTIFPPMGVQIEESFVSNHFRIVA